MDEELLAKRRTLGNVRFIGELFKLKESFERVYHALLFRVYSNINFYFLKTDVDRDNHARVCR